MSRTIRVTVWNEFRHERDPGHPASKLYPEGMHTPIARYLAAQPGMEARTATLDEPEHGLTEDVLASTDVLVWWGHMAHHEVLDPVVDRVHARVLDGMGLIPLHSALQSRIFMRLMGTTCNLKWREAGDRERLWVVEQGHPIAAGLAEYVELAHEEMYGEPFDIPAPDVLVFIGWFQGGEVFRSGCCYYRRRGKVFYFQPGHETYPTYYNEDVLRVIANAARWAAPVDGPTPVYGHVPVPLERFAEDDGIAG